MAIRLLYFCFVLFLCSCGEQKTTKMLADELIERVEALPGIVSSVSDQQSAEAAAKEINALKIEVRRLNKQVKEGEVLSRKDRLALESRLRAVNGEVEFLLKKLRGEPALLLLLTDPLANLGHELEGSRSVMKAAQ